MIGMRCVSNCFEDSPEDEELSAPRMWSNPDSWENLPGRIPLPDEDVIIEPGWDMIYDLADTDYVHDYVEVNGKLRFIGGEQTFHARNLFIRAGELEIGTAEDYH